MSSGFVAVEFDDYSDTFSREATVPVAACGTPPPEPPDAAGVVLSGVAVCAAEAAESTVTWTLANDSGGSLHAVGERIFDGSRWSASRCPGRGVGVG